MYHYTGDMGVSLYRRYGCIMLWEIWVYHNTVKKNWCITINDIWVYHNIEDMGIS